MNSKIVIAIIVLILILGVGGFLLVGKSKAPSQSQTTGAEPTKPTQNNIFTSIKDALSKSISLQCSFTDESGRQITAYIKNGLVRSDIVATDPKQSGSVILAKDKKVYFWNGKQGFMMVMPSVEPTQPAAMEKTPTGTTSSGNEAQDMMAAMEKYKNSCKPAVVADSEFTPPTDVTFQDMSKMMQPQVTLPAGAKGTTGGYAVPSQYQQYMQQNQQKTPQGY